MLRFIQYHKTLDVFDRLEELTLGDDLMVICPNPAKADEARKRFDSVGKRSDCLTISRFMRDQINALLDEEVLNNYKGKSELILFLGAVWKKLGMGEDFKLFSHAFSVLTELRSYTVNEQVIEAILENYDAEFASKIIWFHKIMQQMNIVDEHSSYHMLSEKLREGDLDPSYPKDREIIFYGFETFTASQVDLLKSLSLRDHISIFIYRSVFENASDFDWVNWLNTVSEDNIVIGGEEQPHFQIERINFPANYLNKTLKEGIEAIVFGSKRLDQNMIQEVPYDRYHFKQAVDIFDQDFESLWEDLAAYIGSARSTTDCREFLQSLANNCVQTGSYLRLKVALLVMAKINAWEQLSDENLVLSSFDIDVMKESSYLDIPRVNKTFFTQEVRGSLHSLSMLEQISGKNAAIILSSNYGKLNFRDSQYTEKVESYLSSIGPIQTAGFEYQLYQAKLNEFLTQNKVCFYVEENFLKSDTNWNRLLKNVRFQEDAAELDLALKREDLALTRKSYQLKKLSSSKLQLYSDCPQKFYYSYVEKIAPDVQLLDHVDVREIGQIEHEVIEKYLKANKVWDVTQFENVVDGVIEHYLATKRNFNPMELRVEVIAYTQSIIQKLLMMSKTFSVSFKFEEPFRYTKEEVEYRGSIDCFGQSKTLSIILDFKRSNFGFSTKKSITDFRKNQLWFYLKRMIHEGKVDLQGDILFGYIDLSENRNSLLFCTDQDHIALLKQDLEFNNTHHLEDLVGIMGEYDDYEKTQIDKLKKDRDFKASPIDEKACGFCPMEQICSRGVDASS